MARILVIDDDVSMLLVIEQILAAEGHAVTTTTDGIKAAELFRPEPFDVILTDMVMPKREGLEIIIALHREFPEVGVIAMSGGLPRSKIYLDLAARLGAHFTLTKPFHAEDLLAAVAAVLDRGAA